MIDVHSHILPEVDDGSRSLNESLRILGELEELGFDEVFLTPHYMEGSNYSSSKKQNLAIFNKLKTAAKDKDINIKLNLANEVFVSRDLDKVAKSNKVAMLRGKYLLFELPLSGEVNNLMDIIHEIKIAGFTPILAHAERYDFIKRNPSIIDDLREDGVLIQCNYGSIIGKYGGRSKKLVRALLKKQFVDFMGTDVHRKKSDTLKKMPKILKKLRKLTKKEYFDYITMAEALSH